jgi:integrin beta 1
MDLKLSFSFKVKIEVTECPKNPSEWKQRFQIYRVGLNESVTVDLEMLCECPCEIPGNPVK